MIKASLFLLVLGATPALAEDNIFGLQGCEHYLTLQTRSCQVSHYFRCQGTYPGTQVRIDYGINGKSYEVMTDSEARWLRTFSHTDGVLFALEEPERAPASLSALLDGGVNTYDFTTIDQNGNRRHYQGQDRLTGETVMIDGETLKRTEFSFTETDDAGNVVQSVEGREYVSESMRQFIGGIATYTDGTGSYPFDSSPRDFVHPGEAGFESTIPQYECRDMMSSLWPLPGGAG